jgi:hypothetical protein
MGAIFPMASERARLGFVRKREREANGCIGRCCRRATPPTRINA